MTEKMYEAPNFMATNGICVLCRQFGPLTFEHIPPRRAFNNMPAVAHTIYGLGMGSKYQKPPPLLEGKGGLGRFTLCSRCNGFTAERYGAAFADWTMQCLRFARRVTSGNRILLPFHIQPLNVLKQIATMILAVSELRESTAALDGLRRFVLSPQRMAFPSDVVIACYLNPLDPARKDIPQLTQNRLSHACGVLDIREGSSVFVLGEVAFPPIGYVAYVADAGTAVSTDFSSLYSLLPFTSFYYSRRVDFFTMMPVRYPFGPLPGYYPDINKAEKRALLDDNHVLLTHI